MRGGDYIILSVSRRTDIPAFYTEWFFKRLKEGYVLVRNPMNYHQVSRVSLNPEVVDCIVFWTKDPSKMLNKLNLLEKYQYYFQITLTPYDKKLEPGVPDKRLVLESFKQLSSIIGKDKTIWRYDPIIMTNEYELEFHCQQFELLANKLRKYTERCIISFVDLYKKAERNMSQIKLNSIDKQDMLEIGMRFQDIASKYNLKLETCSELIDLSSIGIQHANCIDEQLIGEILGQRLQIGKDKNQRNECGCAASIDIGAYNTCKHGCLYCYANFSDNIVKNNLLKHDPNSPMLIGDIQPEDKITDRKIEIYRTGQINLF